MSDDFWKMKHVYAQMNRTAKSQAAPETKAVRDPKATQTSERNPLATTQVFVGLLNEGTEVWRPVQARQLGGARYEILGPVPAEEMWQFQPGAKVLCKEKAFADGTKGLVAYERIAP